MKDSDDNLLAKLLRKPVFFVGMPRSGTTVIFEAFSRHPDLAWPSNYTEWFPQQPYWELVRAMLDTKRWSVVGRKGQYGKHRLGNRYFPHPAEAYSFWNSHGTKAFGRSYLRDGMPGDETILRLRKAVGLVTRYQHRSRFSAKFTGPPRIRYLSSVFPDAKFVHVVRDGRAVVHSLLRVRFWREKGGYDAPFWQGDFPQEMLKDWETRLKNDPGTLAALQWQHVVGRCREEGAELDAGNFTEIKYEDFVSDPARAINRVLEFAELPQSPQIARYLAAAPKLVNMNRKFAEDFSSEKIDLLTDLMSPMLERYDYLEQGRSA